MAYRRRAGSKTDFNDAQLPLFLPESGWQPLHPSEWPDFHGVKYLGVDTESRDEFLEEQGPGFIRGDAYVCGVSLGDETGRKIYLPIKHDGGNVDPDQVKRYLKVQLTRDYQTKVGANLMYEMEAFWSMGLEMKGPLADIQIAEPLLTEDRDGGNSLENLAKVYLGLSKNEALLREAGASYGSDPKKIMHRLHSRFVGPYAEDDAVLPIQIFMNHQLPQLMSEELMDVWKLESRLLYTLWKMRLRGVRVDLDRAEQLSKEIGGPNGTEEQLLKAIEEDAGFSLNPNSSQDIGKIAEQRGINVPYTKAGWPSITKEWLEDQDDPLLKNIGEYRKIHKMRKDFIDGAILERNVKGRLHPSWHPLREFDDGGGGGGRIRGTRSGRIAASRPNLTQIPSRDPHWGKAIRSLFIADEGCHWVKNDFSQQEPRILLHFAYLMGYAGAKEARQRYIDDPSTDYHQITSDLIKARSGKEVVRRQAKDINLGRSYGMGTKKLAKKLKVSLEVAKEILQYYDLGVPYVKKLSQKCMDVVAYRGYIVTIKGRRRRFDKWECSDWDKRIPGQPLMVSSYEQAVELWGRDYVQRANLHKSLNALVQGSAADQMKQALVDLDEEGLAPQIQVYDELDGSYDSDSKLPRLKEIMENAIHFEVPHLADPEWGRSWGETSDGEWVDPLFEQLTEYGE